MIKQNSYLSSARFTHSEDQGKAASAARARQAPIQRGGHNRNRIAREIIFTRGTGFLAVFGVLILFAVAINSKLSVTNSELGRQIKELELQKADLQVQRDQEESKWANMVSLGRFDEAMKRHGISMPPTNPGQRVALSVDTAHPPRYNAGEWTVASAE